MSIISRRSTPRRPSRTPPTKALSDLEVKNIQQRVDRQREADDGTQSPRSESPVSRVQRLLCGCEAENLAPDGEPSASQQFNPKKRTLTFQQRLDKLSAVITAGRFAARVRGALAPREVPNSSPHHIATEEKSIPIASTRQA
jgi:hypothetical protein